MTYIVAISSNHPDVEGFAERIGVAFSRAGFVVAVLRGVKIETAWAYNSEKQLYADTSWTLWREGDGVELDNPVGLVQRANVGGV